MIHVLRQGGLSDLVSKSSKLDIVSAPFESANARSPDIAKATNTETDNRIADLALPSKSSKEKTFPASKAELSLQDSQNPYASVGEYTTKQNPNSPSLILVSKDLADVKDDLSVIIRLQYQNCYWGRASNSEQVAEYLEMKRLTHLPIDIISLPPLASAKGSVAPVAWMQVHEHFSYLYSGWGNRLSLEEIRIVDTNNKSILLHGNGPAILRGFETIRFMGKPEIEQLYIHPIRRMEFAPAIHDIELMENHGLWVYAGYAWLDLGKFEAALSAFEKAIFKGLDDEINQQVHEKINFLKGTN